ncbi:hypothetical protein GLOTRDRAFT_122277 [Gloeophyllum trabeum ATCC 11539]|uniref:Uncharacterized protein n=1 Tax=Gloeophyllum trabeum (strain ATCC 11539 / FP-39264 / Madison 617) TaxID=670483 RepID=S7RM42_GLOTA|nr:uncharacterized protein GLOTRDRAFT_122277 [Gloeophyllum trabeum ATCC 11539]EPQ53779.1 hypothetical protein GLOTRDRAFT_122277 [Gloeophyllum trabeum ATCC 11539]
MPLKRALESSSSSPPPVAKRVAGPSSVFSTPYTPKKHRLPVPSDSPTNPFSLNRKQNANALKLPPPISFKHHLALRMQLVTHPSRADLYEGGKMPPFRIVSVPTNYTFKLFHKLIMFLFECEEPVSKGKDDAHLFELVRRVAMHATNERPGQMKMGSIHAKLSNERDPYYRCGGLVEEVDEEDEDSDDGDWTWENEEELTLENAWPHGPDLRRGIVYHHNNYTIIHITINTVPLPERKGIGNRPYTFLARGHIDLNEQPAPAPLTPTTDAGANAPLSPKSPPKLRLPLFKPKLGIFPSGKNALPLAPWMSRPQDKEAAISVLRWNAHAAWENYVDRCREVERLRALQLARAQKARRVERESDAPSSDAMPSSDSFADAPTPGLALMSSSPFPYDSIPPTPAPVQPLHRLIVDRTSRRLSRLAEKGLYEFDSDEEEVDQLAGDEGLFDGDAAVQLARGNSKIKGIDRDEDGWTWEEPVKKETKELEEVVVYQDDEVEI